MQKYLNLNQTWLNTGIVLMMLVLLFISENLIILFLSGVTALIFVYELLNKNFNLPKSENLFKKPKVEEQSERAEIKREPIEENIIPGFDIGKQDKIILEEVPSKVKTEKIVTEISSNEIQDWNPNEEIKLLISNILKLTKEFLFAHTTCFYWFNADTNQLVLASKNTDSLNFNVERKRTLGNDLISESIIQKKAILINHLSKEKEDSQLGYYTVSQGIQSVITMPVLMQAELKLNVVGIIVADSIADDAFGEETINSIKNISQLISSLLKSQSEKFDLTLESTLLNSEHKIRNKIQSEESFIGVINQLVEEISQQIAWNAIATVLFDNDLQKWIIASSRTRFNTKYVVTKQEISINNSIVGKTIKENGIQMVPRFEEYAIPRFMTQEKEIGILGRGSFLSIPISGFKKCFGAITIENSDNYIFSNKEIENIQNLTLLSGLAMELQSLSKAVSFYKPTDEIPQLFKNSYFRERLETELKRADDIGSDLSLVLITITNPEEVQLRFGPKGFLEAMKLMVEVVLQNVRIYDLLGRIDNRTIAIALTHTSSNEAYIWAEKIRTKVSTAPILFEENSFSVTITCGVCGVVENMNGEILIDNADEALKKAIKTGGNLVGIY